MRLAALILIVIASAALMTPPSTAWAQAKRPSIRDELPEGTRSDWDRAKDLYEDQKFSGALVQFQKVYDKTKNARVLYNVGVSLKGMQRYARAIAVWEKQIRFADKLTAKDVGRAKRSIEALRPFVSTLELKTNVTGATLFISGDKIGETPFLEAVAIDVGEQKIQLRKKGYITAEKSVNVTAGTPARVKLELEPAKKLTKVSVGIDGAPKATIFIDSIEMGPAPYDGTVPAGRHTFEARAAGFVTARQTSEVKFGKPINMVLTLTESHDEGKVKIITGFEDAVIEIDGKVVGSGAWEGVLPSGGHQLSVSKDGYDTHESDFALSPDQERELHIELEPSRGTGWIWWTVSSVVLVAGAGVATYFVVLPAEGSEVTGTLNPGVVTTGIRF
jgi:hypothetical protein